MITQPLAEHLYSSEERNPCSAPLRRRTNSGEEQGKKKKKNFKLEIQLMNEFRCCRIGRRLSSAVFAVESSAGHGSTALLSRPQERPAGPRFRIQALWSQRPPQFHENSSEESCLSCLCNGGTTLSSLTSFIDWFSILLLLDSIETLNP